MFLKHRIQLFTQLRRFNLPTTQEKNGLRCELKDNFCFYKKKKFVFSAIAAHLTKGKYKTRIWGRIYIYTQTKKNPC